MATRATMTLDQFLALPETEPASEYAHGEVAQKPMPTKEDGFLQGYLFHVLFVFLSTTGLGRVGTEIRCVFGPAEDRRTYVPDVVYIPRTELTNERHHHAPPALAIEILSPGQPMGRFAEKVQFYLDNGVRMLWIIDPIERAVTVLAPGRPGRTLDAEDILNGGDVLPGFTVSVADILAQARF